MLGVGGGTEFSVVVPGRGRSASFRWHRVIKRRSSSGNTLGQMTADGEMQVKQYLCGHSGYRLSSEAFSLGSARQRGRW